VFNPVLQGRKFDAEGDYVRRWVPELKGLPASVIHKPWTAARGVLLAGGGELGESYPEPVVEHGAARERALAALAEIKAGTRE
jgi:deoxyribodipyrimidine photo-lyase